MKGQGRKQSSFLMYVLGIGICIGFFNSALVRDDASAVSLERGEIVEKSSSKGGSDFNDNHNQQLSSVILLDTYIAQHSADVLRKEQRQQQENANGKTKLLLGRSRRKFMIAYYSCPHRSGNILHNFFNNIAWAILTNHTVLFQYYPVKGNEDEALCEQILTRASWLPRYQDLFDATVLPVALGPREMLRGDFQHHVVAIPPQLPFVKAKIATSTNETHTRDVHRVGWDMDPYKLIQQTRLRPTSAASYDEYQQMFHSRLRDMYAQGLPFFYGLLFQRSFTIQMFIEAEQVHVQPSTSSNHATTFSIALHSRHPVSSDDGSFAHNEIQCLKKVLKRRRRSTSRGRRLEPCAIYLMSDRPKTIQLIRAWLEADAKAHNCTVYVPAEAETASQISGPTASSSEHGSRAGFGFFRDLVQTAEARDAFVGVKLRQDAVPRWKRFVTSQSVVRKYSLPARSSTALLLERIEFNRRSKRRRTEGALIMGASSSSSTTYPMLYCELPFRNERKGYSYGCGSPLFQRNTT